MIKDLDAKYPFPPPVPPAQPRTGGVLHLPTGVLRSFDPTVGYTAELALVWDTLLEWESTWYFPEAQTKPLIRKSLAESWDMVDPSTWVFHLRKGVKFHNLPPVNGREMTAEDVRYSYELLKGKPGYSNRTAVIKEVQVLDPYTVRFHLNLPDPNFPLNHVNSFSPVILPREAVEAHNGEALAQRKAFDALSAEQQNQLVEFLKSLQVLAPGSRSLVVDEHGNPKKWPPSGDSAGDQQ